MPRFRIIQVMVLTSIFVLIILKFNSKARIDKPETNDFYAESLKPRPGSLPQIMSRREICKLLESIMARVVVEIGVREGNFAMLLLKKCNVVKYYGIDPWRHQSNYKDELNSPNDTHAHLYKRTELELGGKFGNRVTLIRKLSSEAASQFSDASIDFIYMDGRRDYCAVLQDLELYWPKVRSGGIMSGYGELNHQRDNESISSQIMKDRFANFFNKKSEPKISPVRSDTTP
jgi:predicted O-methyltransferase YrrM